jgi:hypothetical protein
MASSNPLILNVAINAKGALMTNIILSILCSKVTVIEDPSYNGGQMQGLTGYYIDPNPPQEAVPIELGVAPPNASPQNLQVWLPNSEGQRGRAYEPIEFGGSEGGRVHGGEGNYVGGTGTVILQLTTNSVNAGGVIVEMWP